MSYFNAKYYMLITILHSSDTFSYFNSREMEGIELRYRNDSCAGGGIVKHVLDFKLADNRSAKGLLDVALSTLVDEHDISFKDGTVSNTFDGASVMSGEKG